MGSLAYRGFEALISPHLRLATKLAADRAQGVAPLASAIEDGTIYPATCCAASARSARGAAMCLRRAGRLALRHPVDRCTRRKSAAPRPHGVVPEHAGLVCRQFLQHETRRALR